MIEIFLIGSGGHARACIDVIECESRFKIIGLIEKDVSLTKNNLGYPIIGVDDDLEKLRNKYKNAFITIGQIKSPDTRIKLYKILDKLHFNMPVIKSPLSYISEHAEVDKGTIIMHGTVVNAGSKIGRNCIINNQALIEHDAEVGDHCHIATGAIINGEVTVGDGTFIGSGVVTKHCIRIGRNCVIGSGAIIKTDIPDNQLVIN